MLRVDVKMPFGPGAYLVRMEGVLGEEVDLVERLSGLSGYVVVDLDGVTRVTSFGIREWLKAFTRLNARYYAYLRCRPPLLRQFNMIAGFEVQGSLISFYVPHVCPHCDEHFETLVDLRFEKVGAVEELRERACPSCGRPAVFDESDDYLEFPASHPRPVVPSLAQQLIDGQGPGHIGKLTLAKSIDGDVTVVRLRGHLDTGPQLERWTEGLEGTVRIDLAGIRSASAEGIAKLVEVVPHPPSGRTLYEGVRLDICQPLFDAAPEQEGPELVSVLVPAWCRSCEVAVEAPLRVGGPVSSLACPQCGGTQTLEVRGDGIEEGKSYLRRGSASLPSEPEAPLPARAGPEPGGDDWERREPGAAPPAGPEEIVAKSGAFREVLQISSQVAATDSTVLLRGETGTGKELIASYIHALSRRKDRPFVAVNCAALPEGLIESELFGHEKGAFTGASALRIGRFERADGGTLFIDEVGDLPPAIQVKLLRALQECYIERVGGKTPIPVNIRLVAATHRDLEGMMKEGTFRQDLFYRLNVVPINLPPLRKRPEDILPLAERYLERFQSRSGKQGIKLSPQTRAVLRDYSWPGNVRQLINVIERAVALTPSNTDAKVTELSAQTAGDGQASAEQVAGNLRDAVEDYERKLIADALERCGGNQTAAAKSLGLSRQSLRHKIIKYRLLE